MLRIVALIGLGLCMIGWAYFGSISMSTSPGFDLDEDSPVIAKVFENYGDRIRESGLVSIESNGETGVVIYLDQGDRVEIPVKYPRLHAVQSSHMHVAPGFYSETLRFDIQGQLARIRLKYSDGSQTEQYDVLYWAMSTHIVHALSQIEREQRRRERWGLANSERVTKEAIKQEASDEQL